jgi:hypothetical protein
MENQLNELFALPINMEVAATISGIPLYSSKTIREKFVESLKATKRGKSISKVSSFMVATGKIVPCYAESGMLSTFKKMIAKDTSGGLLRILRKFIGKKSSESPLDYVLAFYDFNNSKIIVLISNHITENFSFTASDTAITVSLTHEMMHMYAHLNPSKFLSLFKDELNSFYSTYFNEIFKLKDKKAVENIVEDIYKYLFLKEEIESSGSIKTVGDKLLEMQKFSHLNEEEFKDVVNDYLKVIKIIKQKDINKFLTLAKNKYEYIINPLYDSYLISVGKMPIKGCAQEMIYPSEVICGMTDIKFTSKIRTALQSL